MPVLVYMARNLRVVEWRAGPLVRGVMCSGLAGLAAWGSAQALGGVVGLMAGLAAGTVAFTAIGSVVHLLSHDDAVWLDAALGARLGGGVGRAVRLFAR